MHLKSKKILAREFLVLTFVISIGLLAFLLTYPYNKYKIRNENQIASKISIKKEQLDSLNSLDLRIDYIITINENTFKILHEFDSTEGKHLSYNELKMLIRRPKERKAYFDEFNGKMGFKNLDEFEDILQTEESKSKFIISKHRIDSIKAIKTVALQQELDELNKKRSIVRKNILTKQQQFDFAIWTTSIMAVILILLRFAYYGITWSISTLRIKENENDKTP